MYPNSKAQATMSRPLSFPANVRGGDAIPILLAIPKLERIHRFQAARYLTVLARIEKLFQPDPCFQGHVAVALGAN
jgi:hypothetical protein